ncbi:MAG: hypothetical protein KAT88_09375 [Spirochaetes bacterium]|nr:hypothetical protein [Spirochaetota bacterium]
MRISMILIRFMILITGLSLFFFGCSKNKVEELKKERSFSIPIGSGVEEIGVLKSDSGLFSGPGSVIFKNGFFYVVDTVNQKLLKVTKPGDVILVISRGTRKENEKENVLRTKQRKYFEFNNIGKVAVDNENNIYIENKFIEKLPEKTEIDIFSTESIMEQEKHEIYVSYILKFDRLGNFMYKIGKNGINSDPFFYIYKTDVDDDGNLIVLTVDEEWKTWDYYKFDSEGNQLFYDHISSEEIFDVKSMEDTTFFIMDTMLVCSTGHLIYWISLYDTTYDTEDLIKEEELWGEEIEIEDIEKLKDKEDKIKQNYRRDLLYYKLLFYDIESGEIDRSYKWENRSGNQPGVTEEFLGIDGKTNGFLWRYVNSTKAIISILRPNGTLIARRSFIFEDDGIWTNLNVAVDGSISALKIDDKSLHFYRWRSDRLMYNKREQVTVKEFVEDKIDKFKNANR